MMESSSHQQNKQEIICAAIDIGSNSTELSIARCQADRLEMLKDESNMLVIAGDVLFASKKPNHVK